MADTSEEPVRSVSSRPRVFRCPQWLRVMSSVIRLLSEPVNNRVFLPRMYLSASHEVFGVTLILTWLYSFYFYPEQIFDHPARRIIGSFNPCFGWDYAPASYVALSFCSCNVYFTWRYAWLEQVRNILQNPDGPTPVQRFSNFASSFLALASNSWLLLWLIGPAKDVPGDSPTVHHWLIHTCIFMTYALASFLAALGNYLEVAIGPSSPYVQPKHTVFIIVYGVSLGYLVSVYLYDICQYRQGAPPAMHPALVQLSDILWIACVASITSFLPYEPPLKVTICFATPDEENALE